MADDPKPLPHQAIWLDFLKCRSGANVLLRFLEPSMGKSLELGIITPPNDEADLLAQVTFLDSDWSPGSCTQARHRRLRPALPMIGHELPEIPESRHRSKRIWKKLCKRRGQTAPPIFGPMVDIMLPASVEEKLSDTLATFQKGNHVKEMKS